MGKGIFLLYTLWKGVLLMDEIDISKEAIEKDLALIKTCLRLINQAVTLRKRRGETFTTVENEELHILISKIDKDLNNLKVNINYDTKNTRDR